MKIELREFLRDDGSSPYQEWFEGLDAQAAAKVATAEYRMSMGNTSNIKWFEGIGEYRIDWGPGYRIYLARDGEQLIVLFGGGTKKRQQADIDNAKALRDEYKRRKRQAKQGGK
ncbi:MULTISPECIES: type II toxin-antitoxin system RelE/ParE family toxin [Chromohalobacter]|uniref:Putative addiction module killer protein n=1 Tax=Chromohalobacter canadensis TaxID=141389 RepID=A0A285VMU9_9GAMM|nr:MULTISPECIES: type II toxin-antitoxin system RelE/ParE family toxin [Chromohalobacter]MCK0754243.1 type II toxin-antitoxin system RelE/ParE family toxin [Chromohalobacter japonicus]PWW28178.1 putative addiction module killer protein [Chromohalobacter salexigens]SOC53901.1 putative addiction module killer protein [Chromohalobacter canadensis]